MPGLVKVTTYDQGNRAHDQQWMTPDGYYALLAALPAGWRARWI